MKRRVHPKQAGDARLGENQHRADSGGSPPGLLGSWRCDQTTSLKMRILPRHLPRNPPHIYTVYSKPESFLHLLCLGHQSILSTFQISGKMTGQTF